MKATRARQKQLLLLGSGRQRFSFLDPRCLGWVPGRAPFSQLTNRCEDSTMMGQGTVGEGKACNFTNPQWTIANQIAKLLTTLTSCFQVQLSVGIATSEKCRVDLRVSIISSYQGWIDINWSNVNMASTNQISFRQAKKRSK